MKRIERTQEEKERRLLRARDDRSAKATSRKARLRPLTGGQGPAGQQSDADGDGLHPALEKD